MVARDRLGDWPGATPPEGAFVPTDGGRFVSNIVFMGMGEPLYNLDNVCDAIGVLSDNEGLGLSRRRITVSTSGVVPQMERLGSARQTACSRSRCTPCATSCATSSCRSTGSTRSRSCSRPAGTIPALSNARRITFEYVMLKGVNDSRRATRASWCASSRASRPRST